MNRISADRTCEGKAGAAGDQADRRAPGSGALVPGRADRLIAATASHLGVPLITRDPAIAGAAGVELVW